MSDSCTALTLFLPDKDEDTQVLTLRNVCDPAEFSLSEDAKVELMEYLKVDTLEPDPKWNKTTRQHFMKAVEASTEFWRRDAVVREIKVLHLAPRQALARQAENEAKQDSHVFHRSLVEHQERFPPAPKLLPPTAEQKAAHCTEG